MECGELGRGEFEVGLIQKFFDKILFHEELYSMVFDFCLFFDAMNIGLCSGTTGTSDFCDAR